MIIHGQFCVNTMYCNECQAHFESIHIKSIDLGKCHICLEIDDREGVEPVYDAIMLKDLAGDGKMIPICAECED